MISSAEQLVSVLKEHQPTNKSTGGFLNICTCGEAVDFAAGHQSEEIVKLYEKLYDTDEDLDMLVLDLTSTLAYHQVLIAVNSSAYDCNCGIQVNNMLKHQALTIISTLRGIYPKFFNLV